jgi:dTDP-4-amino-4,6-dideoxygalactose transaminase
LVLKYFKSFYSFFVSIGIVEKFSDRKSVEIDTHPIIPSLMHPVQKSVLVRKLKHFVKEELQTRHNFKILKNSVNAHVLDAKINNHLYATILLDATSRHEFSGYLSGKGVQSVWNYIPLYYSEVLFANPNDFPNTEKLWRQVLSVPFRYPMKQSRVQQIASIINSYDGYADKKN